MDAGLRRHDAAKGAIEAEIITLQRRLFSDVLIRIAAIRFLLEELAQLSVVCDECHPKRRNIRRLLQLRRIKPQRDRSNCAVQLFLVTEPYPIDEY